MIKYVFGPVASRRLGISLGVDIIPFKTCTLDCIYCECGKSTDITLERKRFVEPGVVLEEIKDILRNDKNIEYITFSGSGEPTLNTDLGEITRGIKAITPIPVAVLTNGTLLYREDVRRDLSMADLVLPSLDAVSPEVFAKISRPHKDLDVNMIIQGLKQFRKEFSRAIWLEVFLAKGINDHADELDKIYRVIGEIKPDKVQLNSLDRPSAYEGVEAVSMDTLEALVRQWTGIPVEICKRIRKREDITAFNKNLENNILNTIKRRPLTIDDLEALTGKRRIELFKYIDVLEREKKIFPKIVGDKIFYAKISKR